MHHNGAKRAQRRRTLRAPERHCDIMDSKPAASSCAAARASRACVQRSGRSIIWRAVHGDCGRGRCRQGVGLSKLEGRGANMVSSRRQRAGRVEPTRLPRCCVWRQRQRKFSPQNIPYSILKVLPYTGIRSSVDPRALPRHIATAALPHPPDPSTAAPVSTLLPIPGYPDHWTCRWRLKHPCACIWRAQL